MGVSSGDGVDKFSGSAGPRDTLQLFTYQSLAFMEIRNQSVHHKINTESGSRLKGSRLKGSVTN